MVKIDRFQLFVPKFEEAVHVFEEELKKGFSEVAVRAVDCPDLSSKPFQVAAAGLCGNTKTIQVGGTKNLLPLYKDDKRYDLKEISKEIRCANSLFVGAGAGPFYDIGQNSELISNVKFCGSEDDANNQGYLSVIRSLSDGHALQRHESEHFGLLGDFFISDGKSGKVLEIRTKVRTGQLDFITNLSNIMTAAWPSQSVSLGGVFVASRGRTKAHVMPDFSETPLLDNDDVNGWLRFFEVGAPFVAFGTLTTNDPGYDIRATHFHGINRDANAGGHFHTDLDPEEVEYLAYLNFSEEFIRYDQPLLKT